ncbi:phosphoglycerate mutase family protein [Phlyctema vagabunda]|uniref:Phosphoglycerate mutase family protein n=1 Tax=Phlyctema vagabunda TaxID=108571 RepID=A0ABR4P3C0_9HELO
MPTEKRKVTFHLVRHAQAVHNVDRDPKNAGIPNPELTPFGIRQCARLRSSFPHMDKINIVLCSPLTRTLETALHGFAPLFQRGLQAILWSDLIEWGDAPCNDFGSWPNFSAAVPDPDKNLELMTGVRYLSSEHRKEDQNIRVERVKRGLLMLASAMQSADGMWIGIQVGKLAQGGGDIHILVVSHGGFLKSLSDATASFYNAQYRSYVVPDLDDPMFRSVASQKLVETKRSRSTLFVRLVPRKQIYPHFNNLVSVEEQMAKLPKYALGPVSNKARAGETAETTHEHGQ